MPEREISRRAFLVRTGSAIAGMTLLAPLMAEAATGQVDEQIIPWLDQPPVTGGGTQLQWEELDSWITPMDQFFSVRHYNQPSIDASSWRLTINGQVHRPLELTLADIRAFPRRELVCAIECSGNHGSPSFIGAIGNARWAGTPLAPLLEEAGVLPSGTEVVFLGQDTGEEEVRRITMHQAFGRSLSLIDAMNADPLLCYEMNGDPLPPANGFPLRLVIPGWYGVANVKWLRRIEVRDSRYMGRFMARDYVTIREERRNGETVWMETSVGRSLLKSVPANVSLMNGRYRIIGAAWGGFIARVEVRIDAGPWIEAAVDTVEEAPFAWQLWSLDWPDPSAGEHTITSRAIDTSGRVQPAMDDPWIANKHTRWESNGQVTRYIRI